MIKDFVKQKLGNQSGFTLIEMLVVVIILGILAMIIVPQITVSTDDARLNSLQANLGTVRSAVELYAAQHSNVYPGKHDNTTGADAVGDPQARTAFLAQMTLYSNLLGVTSSTKNAAFPFGPYVKMGANTLPENPYSAGATIAIRSDIVCNLAQNDLSAARAAAGANEGWQFFPELGIFFPNDAAHLNL
jgi:prepilin-type N-terminal cleavage/methylation domain-containing protein